MNRRGTAPHRAWRLVRDLLIGVTITVAFLAGGEIVCWCIADNHYLHTVRDAHLEMRKAAGERRVFVYGESTVFGYPYGADNSTARWLQVVFDGTLPEYPVRVMNFGLVARPSDYIGDVVRYTLRYQPDVVVLCMGHNDFNGAAVTFAQRPWHRWWYARSYLYGRAYRAAERLQSRLARGKPRPLLIPRDSELRRVLLDSYRANLETMIMLAQARGAAVVLCIPGSNVRGQSPVRSEDPLADHEGHTASVQAALSTLVAAVQDQDADPMAVQGALAVAPEYAALDYWYGRWLDSRGQFAEADRWLTRAKDLDASPIRCVSEQADIIRDLGRQYHVPVVDLTAALRAASGGRSPGWDLFVSHCHPRPAGQYVMAVEMARTLAARGWPAPASSWHWVNLPRAREAVSRVVDSAQSWRQVDRQFIFERFQTRTAEIASDFLEEPGLLWDDADPELLALRGLSRALSAGPSVSRLMWALEPEPERRAMQAAVARWPPEIRELWGATLEAAPISCGQQGCSAGAWHDSPQAEDAPCRS